MSEGRPSLRILVVDDQEPTRYIFSRILTKSGFSVDTASTGREGLDKASTLPDLIISDVNLPDMLGYEMVRRLKQSPHTTSIPVLQVSASFVTDESKVQGLEGGAPSRATRRPDAGRRKVPRRRPWSPSGPRFLWTASWCRCRARPKSTPILHMVKQHSTIRFVSFRARRSKPCAWLIPRMVNVRL